MGYQATSAVLSVFVVCVILWLIRKDHLHPRRALGWVVLAILIGTLGVFPDISDWVAGLLGVDYPPTLFLVTGLLLVFIKLLRLDIAHSEDDHRIATLTQKLSVLEKRFEQHFNNKDN